MDARRIQKKMIAKAEELGIASRWSPPSLEEIEWIETNEGKGTPWPDTVSGVWREMELKRLRRNSFQPYYIKKQLGK